MIRKIENNITLSLPLIEELTKYNIFDSKLRPNCIGVYFLLDESDKIIYIGKSKNIRNRLSNHLLGFGRGLFKQTPQVNPSEIKSFKFIELNIDELDYAEKAYIYYYRPFRNNNQYWREILPTNYIPPEELREMTEDIGD